MNEAATLSTTEVSVKLIGVLGSAAGAREMTFDTHNTMAVQELVSMLLKKVDSRLFRELLVEPGTEDPRANVIILLNDQDCNVYDGLKTRIEPGTRVTIIPVAHGG